MEKKAIAKLFAGLVYWIMIFSGIFFVAVLLKLIYRVFLLGWGSV